MPGLIGMNVGGRLHLLLDGLVGRGEHGTHPPLRLTDGAPAKTQAEMLFELLLYLADALVKLAALQRDVAEQIGPIWLLLTLSGSAAWVVPIHREQVARYSWCSVTR